MVNHFRTLLLNLPRVADQGAFGQFIPATFSSLRLGDVGGLLHSRLFTAADTRDKKELAATLVFRIMNEHEVVSKIMDGIDPRITFDPRAAIFEDPPSIVRVIPALSDLAAVMRIPTIFSLPGESGKHHDTVSSLVMESQRDHRPDRQVALMSCALCLSLDSKL